MDVLLSTSTGDVEMTFESIHHELFLLQICLIDLSGDWYISRFRAD